MAVLFRTVPDKRGSLKGEMWGLLGHLPLSDVFGLGEMARSAYFS